MSSPNAISIGDHVALRSGVYVGVVDSVGNDEHGVDVKIAGRFGSTIQNYRFDELVVCEKISG